MLEKLLSLKLPPGLYKNGTKYQAKGRWFDSNLVRFYEGAIRPVQGWRVASDSDGNPMPALEGTPRAALAWRSAAGDALLAVGTNSHLYVIKAGVTYDITPADFVSGSADAGGGDYGSGLYGANLYGEGKAPLAATLTEADTWQLDAFGDVLVACCTKGGRIYVWTGDTSSAAVVAGGSSPEPNRGVVITPERFVVALGAGDGTDIDVRKVQWASQATTDTWAPLDTNTAGDFTLSTNGRIMCGRRTKAQTLIWTDTDMHSMNYIGGTLVYSFKQEGDNCGIISPQAVAVVDTAAIWMGRNNFYMYDGFVKPVPCEVHDHVFDNFNAAAASKVFACPVSEFSEIWWFYPSAGSTENDRYVVFNYRENHWTVGTLARTAAIDRGALPSPVMFDGNGTVYQHEQGAGTRTVPVSTVISDTLEDDDAVNLEDHTPGGSPTDFDWTKVDGAGLTFASNALVQDGAGDPSLYVASVAPESSAHDVSVNLAIPSTPYAAEVFAGLVVRASGTDAQGVYFGVKTDTPTFLLYALDDTGTELWSESVDVPAGLIGTTVALNLRVSVDGVFVGSANGIDFLTHTDADQTGTKVGLAGGSVGSAPIDNITETFTDTDATALESHTGELGGWTKVDGTAAPTIQTNALEVNDTDDVDALYMLTTGATSADYTVSALLKRFTGDYSQAGWVDLRARGNLTDRAAYVARITANAGTGNPGEFSVQLMRTDASGAVTDLGGSIYDTNIDTDTGATIALKVVGTALSLLVNGTAVLTATDATLTSAGHAGLRLEPNGNTFQFIVDNFKLAYSTPGDDMPFSGDFAVKSAGKAVEVLESAGGATTNSVGEQVLVPFLESGPIELGDGDQVMRVQRIVPDEKNLGDVDARFYAALFPTDAETEQGPFTMAAPTSVRFTARQVRLRLDEVREGADWRIGLTRLGVIPGGRR